MSTAQNLSGSLLRLLAGLVVALTLLFLLNNYFIFWRNWPGVVEFFGNDFDITQSSQGWILFIGNLVALSAVVIYVLITRNRSLRTDAERMDAFAAYLARTAFWAVLLIGLVDITISWLRVENMLPQLIGEELTKQLGRPQFRGTYVHYPLLGLAAVIAFFNRSLGFIWLAFLVVIAEFQIVISRFVFSYEQAFMGDLVRFWYAALFLFASSYTLIEEGHVRVDVFYARFSKRGKAWTNTLGSMFLGVPLCWVILTQGMWSKGSSINSPLLSFEISQSGFGLYVKYLMAGFLVVFAVTMTVQFASYFLSSAADLRGEPGGKPEPEGGGH